MSKAFPSSRALWLFPDPANPNPSRVLPHLAAGLAAGGCQSPAARPLLSAAPHSHRRAPRVGLEEELLAPPVISAPWRADGGSCQGYCSSESSAAGRARGG